MEVGERRLYDCFTISGLWLPFRQSEGIIKGERNGSSVYP